MFTEYITDEIMDPDNKTQNEDDAELSSSGLNIQANEKMPARGELSGQGSLGNTVNTVWLHDVNIH